MPSSGEWNADTQKVTVKRQNSFFDDTHKNAVRERESVRESQRERERERESERERERESERERERER